MRRLFTIDDVHDPSILSCSLLVGLHPDEATEAIVDVALQVEKSFAIVPCCVFPSLFPHRRDAEGSEVRSLFSFLAYLQAKHPSIKRELVPGMLPPNNWVLYKV